MKSEIEKKDIANILFAILFGLLPIVMRTSTIEQHLQNEIFFAFMIAGITYTALEMMTRRREAAEIKDKLEELELLFQDGLRQHTTTNTLATKLADLSSMSATVKSTGSFALNSALAECHIDPKGQKIEITGRGLAYRSYAEFWHSLAIYQRDHSTRKTIVRATHSSDMGAWNDDGSAPIYTAQGEFSRTGAVFRIFIKRDKNFEKIDDYIAVMHRLIYHGVFCAYLTTQDIASNSNVSKNDWTSDFCAVEGQNMTAKWRVAKDNKITSLILDEDPREYEAHIAEWNLLITVLHDVNYKQTVASAVHAAFLEEMRTKFTEQLAILAAQSPPKHP